MKEEDKLKKVLYNLENLPFDLEYVEDPDQINSEIEDFGIYVCLSREPEYFSDFETYFTLAYYLKREKHMETWTLKESEIKEAKKNELIKKIVKELRTINCQVQEEEDKDGELRFEPDRSYEFLVLRQSYKIDNVSLERAYQKI